MGKVDLTDEQLELVSEIKDAIIAIDSGRIRKALNKLDIPEEKLEDVLDNIKDVYRG